MKKILILSFLSLMLFARENPFESTINPNIDTQAKKSEIVDNFENFDFKLPSTARILQSITITYQNIDGSIEKKILPINKSIDWHYPIAITQKDALINDNNDTQYFSAKKMIFFTKDNRLYITTKRKMLRHFILPQPFRILIDLSQDSVDDDETIELKQKYFSLITINKHKDFLRLNITLDGHYQYTIKSSDDGYILSVQ